MSQKNSLQELTIKNNFMFAAVMMDPQNCQELLELILNIPISYVKVDTERSLVYDPRYRGIRMDVYVQDENNTRFDVEMQVRTDCIEKRSRYYHSHMDMDALRSGTEYELLPDSYVIFICDFDPVGAGKWGNVICGWNWRCAMKELQEELKEEPRASSSGWRRAYWIFCRIWARCPKSCVRGFCPSGMLRCCRSF